MRWVSETARNPVWVFKATGHSTECTITKTRLGVPSPNQSIDNGKRAIAGRGLNIEVKVESRSEPIRLDTAKELRAAAINNPMA